MTEQSQTAWNPPRARTVLALCAACIAAILAFAFVLRWSLRTAFPLDAADYTEPAPAGFQYACAVTPSDGAVVLEGWACVAGERFHTVDTRVVLYCAAEDAYLRLPTGMEPNDAPTALLNDGVNYSFGGFYAFVLTKQLAHPLADYELCFAYRSTAHNALIHTGQMLGEVGA